MTVMTRIGNKRMDELKLGDEIAALTDQGIAYSPIVWFHHSDPEQRGTYLTIRTNSNRTITMSGNHMLPLVDCGLKAATRLDFDLYTRFVFASRAVPGSCVLTRDASGEITVEKVQEIDSSVQKGLYAPITSSGTIIVNDIVASCYSSVESQYIQATLHMILEKIWKLWNGLYCVDHTSTDIPMVLRVLLSVTEKVLPNFVFA